MEEASSAASSDGRDEEYEEDYDEAGGGNRLLGFMFGNVDCSGGLDVDYLDEDAKEHLAALADKLGPSLTDIDLTKSSPAPTDISEQDYDEKAEDAVDYEDIDEQYDGPETQSATEEDHLLPKGNYFLSDTTVAILNQKDSVFDEENYDEDEELVKEDAVAGYVEPSSAGPQEDLVPVKGVAPDDIAPTESADAEHMSFELEDFQVHSVSAQDQADSRREISLPVLCVEDGMSILRFSEIFGVHEPLKRAEKKEHRRHFLSRERVKKMDFGDLNLRSALVDGDGDVEEAASDADKDTTDLCICAQPMKDLTSTETTTVQLSSFCPNFYPLDQDDWEDRILWGNSPPSASAASCVISEHEDEPNDADLGESDRYNVQLVEKDDGIANDPVLVDSFGSLNPSPATYLRPSEGSYQPQLVRLESSFKKTQLRTEDGSAECPNQNVLERFDRLSLMNKDFLEGSWLDQVIWDPEESIPKPKLILDLQDDQMLFEVLDNKHSEHLLSHAGAMLITRPSKTSTGDCIDLHSQGMASVGRFNISNDKYYSNRKTSQQAKSHNKKRVSHGIKVMHSVPALKLQTMKPKLSNKEIANFHRPKARWYPHENSAFAKSHRTLGSHGTMKIILLSLGGKGIKLHVEAGETLSSVKSKASKKLEFRSTEKVKIIYSGKELEDDKSLATQNVQPNSVLHVVRTKIHLWPKAQKLPGENKPLRPPGAFKKKSDLSVKDGHVFLMEYCEERPLLLGNAGMGARLCTYYQKFASGDQTLSSLRNGNHGMGSLLTLDPADKSPFLGDIGPGCSQSCIETNMYRAPVFQHKLSSTDYILVRSAKGTLSLRRIDKSYVVGQQEPHMEVLSPGTKNVQTYLVNRMLAHVYREFRAKEKPGSIPYIRADELAMQFPGLTDAFVRKRLKQCADFKRGANGHLLWVKRRDFRIPSEEELRRMMTPESVCSYESMQVGLYRLKHLGISRLTHPVGLSSAMNQLPDEAIALAAASHIERELLITSWNLSSNFVACTNQDRENLERLEITGVGDPSGRGLGFSYVRVSPKAPISGAMVKKKAAAARGGSTVTGTDADLRRLSMDAAREVLVKFKVPEEQIEKLTRWHRIAMVRKLSSEQTASGVKVDAMALSKFARGQRMSFLQLQQQAREKCQEIWDRQVQSLTAADGEDNDSDSEANSDLDSFAGDLENLLDAEEFEEEVHAYSKGDKPDGVRGLKMRRCPSQAQTEEEIEDDELEAAVMRKLLDDDDAEIKKKKPTTTIFHNSHQGSGGWQMMNALHLDAPNSKEITMHDFYEGDRFLSESNASVKVKSKKAYEKNDDIFLTKKKSASAKDGLKVFKEKKPTDKPVRESFVCGACGQLGHMRTNKNCPRYGEDVETSELEGVSGRHNRSDSAAQVQLKTAGMKLASKGTFKISQAEAAQNVERTGSKSQAKTPSLKFKCGQPEKSYDKNLSETQTSDRQNFADAEVEPKPSGKINKIKFSNKLKSDDTQHELQKSSSLIIRLPEKDQSHKRIVIKQSKGSTSAEHSKQSVDSGFDRESRKMKKIAELSSFDGQRQQGNQWAVKQETLRDRRMWDDEHKKGKRVRIEEERSGWMLDKSRSVQEQQRFSDRRYAGAIQEELQKAKKKKKKKKKHDFRDEYLLDHRSYRNDRRLPERDRAAKRRAIVDLEKSEYASSTKRRRGGEVILSNILQSIIDSLKENMEVSYLFIKPVTKKEAPDYFNIIKRPMDLSSIRDKVRNLEYKNREDFRHDVWQITYNAHRYNDGRNPSIPPLADQLLELCDYHLEQRHRELSDAEGGI
ncbi:LOW QUALITY PROTEIN: transcription initiation factor TFIID subunit 1-like [Dioscorea cayenensis subsp. rotundata]|uniref:Transcription initiation factor TFIID subunit 1 n=1 Tax=Dioscorea cayennensis subsp. rotundata TaxID=55577 RepID=A0AB40CKV4_DIOCR|nr:LOW QUALITY PROTEIN: transcription initiation factor TFIID subunit 1-like [Dioscorea cayenensis subsp. rotundata]